MTTNIKELQVIPNEETLKNVLEQNTHVIVYFSNDDFVVSQTVEHILQQFYFKYQKQVEFVKVNCPDHPELERKYEINILPTTMMFYNKKKVNGIKDVIGNDTYSLKKMVQYNPDDKKKRNEFSLLIIHNNKIKNKNENEISINNNKKKFIAIAVCFGIVLFVVFGWFY